MTRATADNRHCLSHLFSPRPIAGVSFVRAADTPEVSTQSRDSRPHGSPTSVNQKNVLLKLISVEKFLHRTKDPKDPHKHRAIVCIICVRCIIGTEAIRKLTKAQISLHKKRLSVGSYEEYYDTTLKPEVMKQYQINVDDFKGMLLSPRSRKYPDRYATCSVCEDYAPIFAAPLIPHKNLNW